MCALSECTRGTIGIIISAWEAQLCVCVCLRGGGGCKVERSFQGGQRGGVQQWPPEHRLCVFRAEGWQVSAIIDYLHTTTLACSRALNSHKAHTPPPLLPPPPSLPSTSFLFVSPSNTHTGGCTGMFTVCQCISVTQCKRERWESPLRAHHSDRNLATLSPLKQSWVDTLQLRRTRSRMCVFMYRCRRAQRKHINYTKYWLW